MIAVRLPDVLTEQHADLRAIAELTVGHVRWLLSVGQVDGGGRAYWWRPVSRGRGWSKEVVHDAAPPLDPAARLMLLCAASKLAAGGGAGDFVCWWCLT